MSETTTAISRDHSQRRYQKRPFGDELGGVIRAKQELTLQFDQLCCGEHNATDVEAKEQALEHLQLAARPGGPADSNRRPRHRGMTAIGGPNEPQGASGGARAADFRPGLMSSPRPAEPGPPLMSMPVRQSRGLMDPDPNAPPHEWSQDGIVFLWLIALILELELLAHSTGS